MKRLSLVVLLGMIITLTIVGCVGNNLSADNNLQREDKEVANTYQNISPEEAKKRLDSEENIILLDVRTVEEYTDKHIPDSLLIPVDVLENEARTKIKELDTDIFVYCRSGNRSVTAANILIKLGYKNVYNLGGIIDWPYDTEAGAPD